MKVYNLRAHVGVQIGARVLTSIDAEKDKFEMEHANGGVWIYEQKAGEKFGYFVPDGTYCSAKVALEDCKRVMDESRSEKRAPGRPKA
jgi:hypothetical protein